MAGVHQYSKQLRIDANIEVIMALNALQAYIKHKRDVDLGRPLGRGGSMVLTYGSTEGNPLALVVYETQTAYIVRRG